MIEKIWEIYEDLNEIVYVSDVDTYELKYMNRLARKLFGDLNKEEVVGKKCYQVLQGCESPCAMCTNSKITPGTFYEWTYFNPVVGTKFALKDTILLFDNKKYRMEIAIDVSKEEQQKQVIRTFENNEKWVNEAIKQALAADNPESSVQILVEYLGKSLNGERAYIFEEKRKGYCDNTYEWCAQNALPQKQNLQNVPKQDLQIWYHEFSANKNVIIENLETIKISDKPLYDILHPQGVHSLVVSPLIYNKNVIGFFGVDNPPLTALKYISTLLSVMAYFFVALLNQRDLVKNLEAISYYDQLTGAKNRHAMEKMIEKLPQNKSIGIVYGDVMELKKTNDTKGHLEGDRLLMECYELLKEFFEGYEVFRVGGDEFAVLCSGIDEPDLSNRVNLLHNKMKTQTAKIALGCVWNPISEDIEKLMMQADQRMYCEKRAYYDAKASALACSLPQVKENNTQTKRNVSEMQYFMERFQFYGAAYFRSTMMKETGLNLFFGDLKSNVYYISDTLKVLLCLNNNIVSDFLSVLKEYFCVQDRENAQEGLDKVWKEKKVFSKICCVADFRVQKKVAVEIWLIVKWDENNQQPVFCVGGLNLL